MIARLHLISILSLVSISANAQTYYGAIDLGSKGVKAFLYSFVNDGTGRDAKSVFQKIQNVPRLAGDAKDGMFSQTGMEEATETVRSLLGDLRKEAAARSLPGVEYYVVMSSGVAMHRNSAELKKMVETAISMPINTVTADEEGRFGFLSAIPKGDRPQAIMVDIGSGNAKLSCMDGEAVVAADVPLGSESLRARAMQKGGNYEAAVQAILSETVKPAMDGAKAKAKCLGSGKAVLGWIGGAAWSTATLSYPETAQWGFVKITRQDIDSTIRRAQDRSYLAPPVGRFGPSVTTKQRAQIQAAAIADHKRVTEAFSREALIAGVSLMKAILGEVKLSGPVIFARNGNYLFGYALERYKEDMKAPEPGLAWPAGTRHVAIINLGSGDIQSCIYGFVRAGNDLKPSSACETETHRLGDTESRPDGKWLKDRHIAEAAAMLGRAVEHLESRLREHGLEQAPHVVAGSSLTSMKNFDALRAAILEEKQVEIEGMTARREAEYSLRAAVPPAFREQAVLADIGSGTTKLGCIVNGRFNHATVNLGTKSLAAEAMATSLERKTDFGSALRSIEQGRLREEYWRESSSTPCLQSRQNVFITGGAAFMAATLLYPDLAVASRFEVHRERLAKLRDDAARGTACTESPRFATATPEARERHQRDRNEICGALFNREQMQAGIAILQTVAAQSSPGAKLLFVRNSLYIEPIAADLVLQGKTAKPISNSVPTI